MCTITAGLAIAGQVAGFAGKMAETSAVNDARAASRASAISSYNTQLENEQRNYIAEQRKVNQRGFDEALKSRDALGKARADAATHGASGISVNAVFSELIGKGARTASRLDDARDTNDTNYMNRIATTHAQMEGRVAANQPVSSPNPLSLVIGAASPAYKGYQSAYGSA